MSPVTEVKREISTNLGYINKLNKFTAFSPQEETLSKVKEIIMDNRNNDMIYGGFKTNHTVHAVYSLYAIGAPPSILDRYYSKAKTYLEPLTKEKFQITVDNYEEFIAQKDAYSSYLKFFDEQVRTLGYIQSLQKYIPRIISGFAGAALHPLIHLGYSVEFKDPLVAAEGLAYGYSYYLPLDEIVNNIKPDSINFEYVQEKLSKLNVDDDKDNLQLRSYSAYLLLKELKAMGVEPLAEKERSNLASAISKLIEAHSSSILKLVDKWGLNENNIEERNKDLSIGTVEIFGGSYRQNTFDFFLLHSLTGNHGVRTLLPILKTEDQIRLLNVNFTALAILFLSQGGPNLTKASTSIPKSIKGGKNDDDAWSEIFVRAAESIDSHLIKGVRNLHQLQKEYGELNGLFFKPAAFAALDIPKNDWNFSGIGYLPEN